MSKINIIQNAIKELEGGSFQKLFDAYLYKKYNFNNIQTLGVQEGTNKTTKGTPDSFIVDETGKYILIMYGTVEADAYNKLKKDILSCYNQDRMKIDESKIAKIICAYSSTNISVDQIEELKKLISGIEIDLIGLSTISHDLLVNFPFLAADFLNIQVDTHQIFTRDEFIKVYDKNGMNAPLDMDFCYREEEKEALSTTTHSSQLVLVTGAAGVGKTRLVLEICRQFEDEGWIVLCVKNNGELLYNDMKYYTSDEGKYLLFIDDANQITSLEYILDYIITLPDKFDVKIVMTVRDYAKHRVKTIICKYMIPSEITINVLKDDEIKDILKNNLGILNNNYLDRIAQIAKGNARLAILAGKVAIENGYLAIQNATDIYASYYRRIIENEELSEDAINALFVVSLLGAIRYKESVIAQRILELVNINKECFIDLCHDLNEKELLDLYQDEVAKVSDQSLGNYIIEYILIEKKSILISQLLVIGFPEFKNKLVYALNTLIKLFNSNDTEKYIEAQVNISWNMAEDGKQEEYLKCFHVLNREKALAVIKQKIDRMKRVEVDILNFDIEGKKNYHNIESDDVAILCDFKYSEYYDEALQLLLLYYEKRPDLIMDFYFAFSDRMAFDVSSHNFDYEKEYKLVDYLWGCAKNGKNINITILLLHVLQELLKCSFRRTEATDNPRTFNMFHLYVVFTNGSKKLRSLIWQILSELYTDQTYMSLVSNIIASSHVSGLSPEEEKRFEEHNLRCIKELFFDKWDCLSFEQCKILRELEKHSHRLKIENKDFFARYTENKDFMIYYTLIQKHVIGRSWEEDEAKRKKQIKKMVKEYKDSDYISLFKICKMCEENNDSEDWSLRSGLDIVFLTLENEEKLYNDVVRLYLKSGAPYGYSADRIIVMLLKNGGLEMALNLVEEYEFPYKHNWQRLIWEFAPEEEINEEFTKRFVKFVEEEAVLDKPEFPNVTCLKKYKVFDLSVVKQISEVIIDCSLERENSVDKFFKYCYQSSTIDLILDLYADNWELLEKLYLLAFGRHFDFDGILLIELVKNNAAFWNQFTLKLKDNMHRTSYEHNVFESIWGLDNYKDLIQVACDNMLGDYFGFMVEDEGVAIFANSENTSDQIRQRKKQWIKEYIKYNFENEEKLRMIFNIIATIFPLDREEFLLEFVSYTKDIELFESIPLFSMSSSWSGSEVPLINKKIDFLGDLINVFGGIDLIDHRAYLKETKTSYEQYKQSVLIREFLEDNDIA